uniref:Uncharacterized protein n=1 Tax=viral metagenome TaxID=1070528 RepID=A0A6C0HSG9_9ZZZZ
MISSCVNDFKPWTLCDKSLIKRDYLDGKPVEMIAQKTKRHANNVCEELISQGVMKRDSLENISLRHIRFEEDYDQDYDQDYDHFIYIEDNYDPYDLNNHYELCEYLFSNVKKGMKYIFSFFI